MKRFIILFILLIFHTGVFSQIQYALVGIDGLTCSACSYATEKSLRSLNFVKDIDFELNKNVAKVTFVKDINPDLNKLAQKVRDAGYSVRNIDLVVVFKSLRIHDQECYTFEDLQLNFIAVKDQVLSGETKIKLVGKGFMSKKEFVKYKDLLKSKCPESEKVKRYYVTL